MDYSLLSEKGVKAQNPRSAFVKDYVLQIGERATMIPKSGEIVYGIMMREYASQHPLKDLAADSGGTSCAFSDNQHTTYYDCLNGVLHHRSPQIAPNQVRETDPNQLIKFWKMFVGRAK